MFLSSSTGCSAMLSPTLRKRVGTTNLPRKVVGTTKLYRDKWLKLRTSSSSLWIPVTASFGHFFLALPFTQRLDPGLKLRTSIEVSGWNYETEKRGWNYEGHLTKSRRISELAAPGGFGDLQHAGSRMKGLTRIRGIVHNLCISFRFAPFYN